MPLVVVMTSVFPRQTSGVKSPGEFPRSNPGIGRPCRSPASRAVPGRQTRRDRLGLVDLAAGDHRLAPGRQGVDHHRGRPQHIDDDRHAASQAPRRDQARQQVDVHLRLMSEGKAVVGCIITIRIPVKQEVVALACESSRMAGSAGLPVYAEADGNDYGIRDPIRGIHP